MPMPALSALVPVQHESSFVEHHIPLAAVSRMELTSETDQNQYVDRMLSDSVSLSIMQDSVQISRVYGSITV
jgi:hypothetical protein